MESAFFLNQCVELSFPNVTLNLVGPDFVRLMNIKISKYQLSDADVLPVSESREGYVEDDVRGFGWVAGIMRASLVKNRRGNVLTSLCFCSVT